MVKIPVNLSEFSVVGPQNPLDRHHFCKSAKLNLPLITFISWRFLWFFLQKKAEKHQSGTD